MRRRDVIALLGGAMAIAPLAARAQSRRKVPVVGFLGIAGRAAHVLDLDGFRLGLRELGHKEGETILIAERFADGNRERLNGLISELLRQGVAVFVVPGPNAAQAVRRLAPQAPVVAVALPATDTYHRDLFTSIRRPGGSVTGFSDFSQDLAAKRVQLLREMMPSLMRLAILYNVSDPYPRERHTETKVAAESQGLETIGLGLTAPSKDELARHINAAHGSGAQGLYVIRDYFSETLLTEIVGAANAAGFAVIAEHRRFADSGALMTYGASLPDLFSRAATYVDQILKGESAAELPIQLPIKFELVVNAKTAKALDLTIPPSILIRAEEVIE